MKNLRALSVDSFLHIDNFKIIRVNRWKEDPYAYADPPTSDEKLIWGFEFSERPGTYFEVGTFNDLMSHINAPKVLLSVASSQPAEFARMIAEGFELGPFFGEDLWSHRFNRKFYPEKLRTRTARFREVRVVGNRIRFHTYVHLALFGPQKDEPGIYSVNFSISKLAVLSKRLVMKA